ADPGAVLRKSEPGRRSARDLAYHAAHEDQALRALRGRKGPRGRGPAMRRHRDGRDGSGIHALFVCLVQESLGAFLVVDFEGWVRYVSPSARCWIGRGAAEDARLW